MTSRASVLRAVVGLLLVIAAFLLGRAFAPKTTAPELSRPHAVDESDSHTEQGAVYAATNFGKALAASFEAPSEYREGLVALSAPGWKEEAEVLAESTLEFVQERYGSAGDLVFAPVRYRVSAYSDDEAEVEIWGATIASGPDSEGIEVSWVTGTIELAWLGEKWLVMGQSSAEGPTPETLASSDEVRSQTLNGFEEYGFVPTP